MIFIASKETGIIPQVLTQILDACVNGVTLADPDLDDMPLVYANKAFETMTGYSQEELIGRNCRFLQGSDREQDARHEIREALEKHEAVAVNLRNYKKSGELFYNHFRITPLFDKAGKVIYYLGVQYDVTQQVLAQEEIKRLNDQLANVTVK